MRLLRMRAEILHPARDPVVKARADVEHRVTAMHRQIGLIKPVHPQHAQPGLARSRVAAQPHQGRGDGKSGGLHKLAQQAAGSRAGVDHAAAGVEHGAFSGFQHFDHARDLLGVTLHARLVMRGAGLFHRGVDRRGELHILGDVHQNRAGPPMHRHMEGLMDRLAQLRRILHQPVVLGAGPGDADRVGLLKPVRADHEGRDLSRQNHQRD